MPRLRLDTRFGGNHRGVLLWVAPGGVGKSALTRWWIQHHDWPAGTRFIGHSFYSQGARNQSTSARPFLFHALKALGVEPETTTPNPHHLVPTLQRRNAARTLQRPDGADTTLERLHLLPRWSVGARWPAKHLGRRVEQARQFHLRADCHRWMVGPLRLTHPTMGRMTRERLRGVPRIAGLRTDALARAAQTPERLRGTA